MNKHYKFFALFSFIIIMIFSSKLYYQHLTTKEIKELSIQYEAESIANFLIAFRGTYQDIFIKNHTTLNASNIDFLPVKTTNEIAKRFSDLSTKSKIATVSDRPRNPKNMANKRQLEAIKYFLENKKSASLFKTIGDKHYYSQPLYINQSCLKCHGKQENAPSIIKNNYNMAYNYKLGDLRGIIDIEVSQTKLSLMLDENYVKKKYFVFTLMAMVLAITFFYTKETVKLSRLVLEKSKELEDVNHTLEDRVQEEIEKNRVKDQKLFQQSRLAQMGEMLSMIAHQWRQPLSSIASTVTNVEVKMAMDKFDFQNKDDALACKNFLSAKLTNIDTYVQSLSTTIDDFRNFYNPNKERKTLLINIPIEKAVSIIKSSMHTQGIELVEEYKSRKKLSLAEGELMQVFLNILKNSQDNFKEKDISNAQVTIKTKDVDEGVQVEICDNGGGIAASIMMQIFDPYFSTKDQKNGTGLGLYMSKTIVEEHHPGKLSVENKDDGVCFTISIKGQVDVS